MTSRIRKSLMKQVKLLGNSKGGVEKPLIFSIFVWNDNDNR